MQKSFNTYFLSVFFVYLFVCSCVRVCVSYCGAKDRVIDAIFIVVRVTAAVRFFFIFIMMVLVRNPMLVIYLIVIGIYAVACERAATVV